MYYEELYNCFTCMRLDERCFCVLFDNFGESVPCIPHESVPCIPRESVPGIPVKVYQ